MLTDMQSLKLGQQTATQQTVTPCPICSTAAANLTATLCHAAKPKGRPRVQHSAHVQATATQLACQHRPNCKPNLSSEADYFANLDTEQLIEDSMPGGLHQKMIQASKQDTSDMVQQSAGLQHAGACTSAQTDTDTHAALQTPDAVWLTAHHPALQVSSAVGH